jgi:hypothetical protein
LGAMRLETNLELRIEELGKEETKRKARCVFMPGDVVQPSDSLQDLCSALKRLGQGKVDQKDVTLVQQAVSSGRITIASNGSVSIGGDVTGNIFVTLTAEAMTILMSRPKVPHQIPPAPLDFTGRDDEVKDLMGLFDGGATIVGLRGLGGVGKTVLAYKLAEMLNDRYPDGQLMVNLQGTGQPLKPAEAMVQVIRSFDPAFSPPDKESDLANSYRSALSGKYALLLLDNAADDRQVRPLLPPSTCSVLVTSRKKFTLPGMKEKDLEVLKPAGSKDLLLDISGRIGDQAADLAQLCGHLPLALRAAGSFLANTPNIETAEYIDELRAERTRLERLGSEGVDLDVEASFNLSYNRLTTDAARAFRMSSVFPASFDAKAEVAICQDEGHKGLNDLVRWSLVDYRSVEGTVRYRLHDLARTFAANRMEKEDGGPALLDMYQRFAEHYSDVLRDAGDLYRQGGEAVLDGLKLFDLEWSNIRAGRAWAEGVTIQAVGSGVKKLSPEKEKALQLCSTYPLYGMNVLFLRLHPSELIRWLETALTAARELDDRGNEGAILGNLGTAYHSLGEYHKAIEHHEQVSVITREFGDRQAEGTSLCAIGIDYYSIGKYWKAIEFYEQALDISRDIGDRLGEGHALSSLGIVHCRLDEFRKAIEFHEQALDIARKLGYRQDEGAALCNLGLVYHSLGEYHEAIEYYEQALAVVRELGDRQGEGDTLFSMSLALKEIREVDKAIEYAKSALKIYELIESPTADKVKLQLALWQAGVNHFRFSL